MADIHARRGELDGARELYKRAVELAERIGDVRSASTTVALLAEVEAADSNDDHALQLLHRSLDLRMRCAPAPADRDDSGDMSPAERLAVAARTAAGSGATLAADAQRARWEALVDLMLPDDIPQPVELLQARRSARMRRDMLARHGYHTAEDLADMHGSRAKNRYALAARWASAGRIFGVPYGGRTAYPAFQFDEAFAPRAIVADVLAALPRKDMSPWAVALWWYANNLWLPDEASPAEVLGSDQEPAIVAAARHLAEPLPL